MTIECQRPERMRIAHTSTHHANKQIPMRIESIDGSDVMSQINHKAEKVMSRWPRFVKISDGWQRVRHNYPDIKFGKPRCQMRFVHSKAENIAVAFLIAIYDLSLWSLNCTELGRLPPGCAAVWRRILIRAAEAITAAELIR